MSVSHCNKDFLLEVLQFLFFMSGCSGFLKFIYQIDGLLCFFHLLPIINIGAMYHFYTHFCVAMLSFLLGIHLGEIPGL